MRLIDADKLMTITDIKENGTEFTYVPYSEIENAEIQTSAIVLPCTEGTMVYEIINNTDACAECDSFCKGYCCDDYCDNRIIDGDENVYPSFPQYSDKPLCNKQFYEVIEHTPNLDWIFNNRNKFEKTVFLTQKEAEQKLIQKK